MMLGTTDISYRVHEVFPIKTAMGRLMLIEVTRDGAIELIGPEHNVQLESVLNRLASVGLNTIIVDGAIDRVTQVAASESAGFIYVLKIDAVELHTAIDKMKLIHLLKEVVQVTDEELEDNGTYQLSGAFTKTKLSTIPDKIETIVVVDFTKVFLSLRDLRSVMKKYQLKFKYHFEFLHYVVNLYNFSKEEFIRLLDNKGIEENILYNPFKTDLN
ncbi:MAG: hypothetical protein IH948_10105 [Bacteroidetes bacterium]|nr:hypothetical protein [Bacteroidota bacterium]